MVNKGRYKILAHKLIYLSHFLSNIALATMFLFFLIIKEPSMAKPMELHGDPNLEVLTAPKQPVFFFFYR